jgi:hypothetical protein
MRVCRAGRRFVAASAVCRAAWAEEIAARGEPGDPLGVFVGEEVWRWSSRHPRHGGAPLCSRGVLIRPEIRLIESRAADLTADLTAVVASRETVLLESLAGRARTRVEQVLVHTARAEALRDGL